MASSIEFDPSPMTFSSETLHFQPMLTNPLCFRPFFSYLKFHFNGKFPFSDFDHCSQFQRDPGSIRIASCKYVLYCRVHYHADNVFLYAWNLSLKNV